MKRDYGKIKEMKVRKFHKLEVFSRLDKKVIGVFLVGITLVLAAGVLGALTASTKDGERIRTNKYLKSFDRIVYWSRARRCSYPTENKDQGGGDKLPICYNPVPQEYALGFINKSASIGRALRNDKAGKAEFYNKMRHLPNDDSKNPNKKSFLRFADFFDGASYMGNLYDFRVYTWRLWGDGGYLRLGGGDNLVAHSNKEDHGGFVSEWHFYPQGTLKQLDELYYDKSVTNYVECEEGTPCDTGGCANIPKPNPGCTYDKNAYRGADGKPIYTGAFRESKDGPIAIIGGEEMTAAGMENYLAEREKHVNLPGVDDSGAFKGTISFSDIDTWEKERYIPARGVETVFTSRVSIERAYHVLDDTKKLNGYKKLCPDASGKICSYAWGGGDESSGSNTESRLWFNFSSTTDTPLTLVYESNYHASGIRNETYTIVYVIKDDLGDIPDDIANLMHTFASNYKSVYGKDLEQDSFFTKDENGPNIDPAQVLRLFQIYRYSDYDPYTINEDIENATDHKYSLKWYTCEDMVESCEVPHDPEHDDGEKTVGDRTYRNGYDFITKNQVYYASISDNIIDPPNTCYSGDNSHVEAEDDN